MRDMYVYNLLTLVIDICCYTAMDTRTNFSSDFQVMLRAGEAGPQGIKGPRDLTKKLLLQERTKIKEEKCQKR